MLKGFTFLQNLSMPPGDAPKRYSVGDIKQQKASSQVFDSRSKSLTPAVKKEPRISFKSFMEERHIFEGDKGI